jgi:hypothetical protein
LFGVAVTNGSEIVLTPTKKEQTRTDCCNQIITSPDEVNLEKDVERYTWRLGNDGILYLTDEKNITWNCRKKD